MLSPEGQATVATAKARKAWLWDDTAPKPTPGSRDIGLVHLIGVGCVVWSKTRSNAEGQVGGVVLEEWRAIDPETGEAGERQFLVAERWCGRVRYAILTLDEIDPALVQAPDDSAVIRLARAIWFDLATGKGLLTSSDIHRLILSMRLVDAIMGDAVQATRRSWSQHMWQTLVGQ